MMRSFWNVQLTPCEGFSHVSLRGVLFTTKQSFNVKKIASPKKQARNDTKLNVQLIVGMFLGMQFFSINFLWAQEESQNPKASAQQQPQNFVYDDHGKRDPFWTLVTPAGVIINYDSDILISDMVLEGIIAGTDGKNLAIINNTIVKPNDQVGLFVIEKIELDKVLLRKGKESFSLKIKKEE